MTKRRHLKKHVRLITNDLIAECLVSLTTGEKKQEDIADLLIRILNLRQDFLSRCSHTQPTDAHRYYQVWRNDFRETVNSVIDSLYSL